MHVHERCYTVSVFLIFPCSRILANKVALVFFGPTSAFFHVMIYPYQILIRTYHLITEADGHTQACLTYPECCGLQLIYLIADMLCALSR